MLMGRMGGEVRAASPVCIAAGPESSEKALYTCAAMNVLGGDWGSLFYRVTMKDRTREMMSWSN